MKIAVIVPHLKVNGGNRIIFTLCTLLSKRGNNVTIITKSPRKLRRKVANILHIGKPKWFPGFRSRVLRVGEFYENDLLGYDRIISLSSYGANFLNECTNIPSYKKFFYPMHDEKLYHYPKEIVEKAYRSPINKIVLSSWIKGIVESYGNKNVPVLISPVDTELFYPIEGLRDPDTVKILMLHHTYDWKGTEEGVEIVERLKKKYPQIRLVMYGVRAEEPSEPHDEYYYNVPQDKLAELYSKADIFLCPSWDEGLGMPGMEAMACKAALVTYDTGGSRDYATDGETAYVASRRNIKELESRLEEAIINVDERKKIALKGYDFIVNMPSWEKQAEKLEKILATSNE